MSVGNFTINQAIRSIKCSIALIVNGNDPNTEYSRLADFPRDKDGRIYFTYPDDGSSDAQNIPFVHGAFGIFLYPGVAIEYGKGVEKYGRNKVPIIISVSRNLQSSPERDNDILDNFCRQKGVDSFVFRNQSCPIYEFATDNDDIIGIVGTINWPYKGTTSYAAPQIQSIWEPNAGGFVKKEYHFPVTFNQRSLDGSF